MRTSFVATVLLCLASSAAFARTPISLIQAVSEHDLVIARCISVDPAEIDCGYGLSHDATVKVLRVLHGDRKLGDLRIATTRPIKPGVTYLFSATPGYRSGGPDFMALNNWSAEAVPENFDLAELDGKSVKEQVEILWSRRLFEVEQECDRLLAEKKQPDARLLAEKKLLESALADRKSAWFESAGPIKLGEVRQASTQSEGKTAWLDLQGHKLQWSQSAPGKSGLLYYEKVGTPRGRPGWEFAPCAANAISDLEGRPLRAKFYGLFSPHGDETGLHWNGPESNGLQFIQVAVNQLLLARTVADPHTVYAIQIIAQSPEEERMVFQYAVIHD